MSSSKTRYVYEDALVEFINSVAQSRLETVLSAYGFERLSKPFYYRIRLNDAPIDLYAKHFDKLDPVRPAYLVGFSGAVSNAAQTSPPYFAGQGLADALQAPLLSFSDPTMALDNCLTLGFYAGNARIPDLPKALARVINDISAKFGARAVMFGGSGGGFAALNTLRHCTARDTAVVWNPQTQLTEYHWTSVLAYAKVAFPALVSRVEATSPISEQRQALSAALRAAGCPISLVPWQCDGSVIYCQNLSDAHHVEKHLQPFSADMSTTRFDDSAMRADAHNVYFYLGDWGKGHAPLQRKMVLHLLDGVLRQEPLDRVVSGVGATLSEPQTARAVHLAEEIRPEQIKVSFEPNGAKLRAKVSLDGASTPNLHFAFYLMSGTQRLDMKWYSDSAEFEFDPTCGKNLTIRVFAKDPFGKIVRCTAACS